MVSSGQRITRAGLAGWALALVVLSAACDPNAKVVRSGQQEPEAPRKEDAATDREKDRGTDEPLEPVRFETNSGGDLTPKNSSDSAQTPSSDTKPADGQGSKAEQNPVASNPPADEGATKPTGASAGQQPTYDDATPLRTPFPPKSPLPAGRSGAKATGRCDTGDWGACFREARPLMASNPQKAIELYLKACLPGQPKGDGLACQAAGLLAAAMGNESQAAQYFAAACNKVDYPVIAACRR